MANGHDVSLQISCLTSASEPQAREVRIGGLVIAGWTGRDRDAVEEHIEELAALGVPRPSRVPLFYRGSASLLTQQAEIEVVGQQTSGEAEALLLQLGDETWVGLGSDHTDRDLEGYSVAAAKQACPKPICTNFWPYEEVAGHWDQLLLRSIIDEDGGKKLYQEGPLSALRHPDDLVRDYCGQDSLPNGTLLFCGTLTARDGIRPSSAMELALVDPVLDRKLSHRYATLALPVIA